MKDVPLSCACGQVRGRIAGARSAPGPRFTCYCIDCQAYAHWLGSSETMLDSYGGTDVVLVYPAQIEITEGHAQLASLRFSPRGPIRWYTKCCRSAIANTLPTPRLAFAGVQRTCVAVADDRAAECLGRSLGGVNGLDARGEPPGAAPKTSWLAIFSTARHLGFGFLRRRNRPSPFFDEAGAPVVEPEIMDRSERAALKDRVRASADGG